MADSQSNGLVEHAIRELNEEDQVEELHKVDLEVDHLINLWLTEFGATPNNVGRKRPNVGLRRSCVMADP